MHACYTARQLEAYLRTLHAAQGLAAAANVALLLMVQADLNRSAAQSGELPEDLGQGTTLGQDFVGSPKDIFTQLPRELRITVEDPAEEAGVRLLC